MTSRPARPRTLLDFINRPILKGVAPAGNLKRVFTGKSGQNRKKIFGRVMYASETIQNCKNPTGHIDTLSKTFLFSKSSAAVIDGSEKRNGWLNFERQSPHVIERRSKGVSLSDCVD